MKKITGFAKINTGEGARISYTYSEIDENGVMISQNNKGSFVVVNDEISQHLNAVEAYIKESFLSE